MLRPKWKKATSESPTYNAVTSLPCHRAEREGSSSSRPRARDLTSLRLITQPASVIDSACEVAVRAELAFSARLGMTCRDSAGKNGLELLPSRCYLRMVSCNFCIDRFGQMRGKAGTAAALQIFLIP